MARKTSIVAGLPTKSKGRIKELTATEKKFIATYREDPNRNATIAYQKTFLKQGQNLENRIVKGRAYRLLKKELVAQEIHRQDKLEISAAVEQEIKRQKQEGLEIEKNNLSVKKVIEGIMLGAFWDAKKLVDEEGNFLPVHKIDPATRAAITGFYGKGYRMMNKEKCLEMLAKCLAMFTEKRELTGADGLPLFEGAVNLNVNFIKAGDRAAPRK